MASKRVVQQETKEYWKIYYIKNKEKRNEQDKQFYIKNRENVLERQKQHRDNNKYICGCGSGVINQNWHIRNHAQTKKHQKYLLKM